MVDHFVISTNLHLFLAYHIAKHQTSSKKLFFVEESLRCSFLEELPGKIIFFSKNDDYYKSIIWGVFAKTKFGIKKRLFFGNQVHAIVSGLINTYEYAELFVLDDGLQYYGKGVEKKNVIWYIKNVIIRNQFNNIISLLGWQCVSTRDYLKFPKLNVEISLISFMTEVDEDLKTESGITLIKFSRFFSIKLHREVSEKYFNKSSKFQFLSFDESKEMINLESGNIPNNIKLHPKFRTTKEACPFEFVWETSVENISANTTLSYVLKFVELNAH